MKAKLKMVSEPTNGGESAIEQGRQYAVNFDLVGTSDLLFHRWNCDAVEAKSKAVKGSKAKKSDDIETYVWRDEKGVLCLPHEYVRQAMLHAAKYRQDPRSPRKSMFDMAKAAFVPLSDLASLGTKVWDYEHRARVTIQRNGITRIRPAMRSGWKASFDFEIILPEYVPHDLFRALLDDAGRLVGLGDYRPTFGRFRVERFEF